MPYTKDELVFNIKQQYPQYQKLSNDELLGKILGTYPQYKEHLVDYEEPEPPKSDLTSFGEHFIPTAIARQIPSHPLDALDSLAKKNAADPVGALSGIGETIKGFALPESQIVEGYKSGGVGGALEKSPLGPITSAIGDAWNQKPGWMGAVAGEGANFALGPIMDYLGKGVSAAGKGYYKGVFNPTSRVSNELARTVAPPMVDEGIGALTRNRLSKAIGDDLTNNASPARAAAERSAIARNRTVPMGEVDNRLGKIREQFTNPNGAIDNPTQAKGFNGAIQPLDEIAPEIINPTTKTVIGRTDPPFEDALHLRRSAGRNAYEQGSAAIKASEDTPYRMQAEKTLSDALSEVLAQTEPEFGKAAAREHTVLDRSRLVKMMEDASYHGTGAIPYALERYTSAAALPLAFLYGHHDPSSIMMALGAAKMLDSAAARTGGGIAMNSIGNGMRKLALTPAQTAAARLALAMEESQNGPTR